MIRLLSDDAKREALLSRIEEVAADPNADPVADEQAPKVSIGRQIASATQEISESIATGALRFWDSLTRAPETLRTVLSVSPDVVLDSVKDLALVVLSTIALFILFRTGAKRLFRRLGAAAQDASTLRTVFLTVVSVLIDASVVVITWAAGYAIALLVFGSVGEIGIRQSLYLNAFMIIEMSKVVTRTFLSPTSGELRLLPLPDQGARAVSRLLGLVISVLGYGQLLIVPIINQNVSFAAGRGVSTLISVIAMMFLIGAVVRYRRSVTQWLLGEREPDGGSSVGQVLARIWYIPTLVYLLVVLGIVLARPGGVLFPVLTASAKIVGAVVVAMIITHFLSRAIARGVTLPGQVNSRLPLLERRLNGFVPRVLTLLRLMVIAGVVLFTLHTLDLANIEGWLESQVGVEVTAMLASVIFILLASFLVWLAFSSWIDFRLNPEFGSVPSSREQTLLSLLRNAITIVLLVITLMFVLSEIGIDIAPLIASAGVLGLAIGFGAQKLVQDIITGVFIQLENAMNVGDVVTVGGTTGTIERLTIRSVSLRDLHGVFHIIPFSSVDMVSNYMRDFGNFVCDMGIAYREDINDARQAMLDGFEELRADETWAAAIIGDLQWFGLQSFGDSAVIVRARIKCVPGQQWAVGRAYNEILKRIFDERGIEIPFPHQTIYFGEDKSGNAPAAPVQLMTPAGGDTP